MPYMETFDRDQMMMCSWDSFIDSESTARLIDKFVDSLDLQKYSIKEAAKEGRPSYDPKGLLKLYIYGCCNGIRSSRKLAKSCKVNIEVKWLNGHTDEYLRILQDMDEEESTNEAPDKLVREEIEAKLEEAKARLQKYEGYQKLLEETGEAQLSLTDADSKLMKNKNGFAMAYNPQTAVDSNTHLIRDFNMTNKVTDHGQIAPTMEDIKKETPDKIVEAVADKGYQNTDDMLKCLENGIIPNVITEDGKDGYYIETSYEEADADSIEPDELRKCIHSGVIPDAYKDVIEDMHVVETRRKDKTSDKSKEEAPASIYGTTDEMIAKAKEGYFVRDPERNLVYCPMGEILRQKCIKKNGNIRYANKNACRHCPNRNKCYKGKNEWKEIDFTKDQLQKPCRDWLAAENRKPEKTASRKKFKMEKVKIVIFFLRPDRAKMNQRMCLSEHPFGTIKRAMGAGYFLRRGMRKVSGEFALFCLSYNINRAKNLLGFEKMMELMAEA